MCQLGTRGDDGRPPVKVGPALQAAKDQVQGRASSLKYRFSLFGPQETKLLDFLANVYLGQRKLFDMDL